MNPFGTKTASPFSNNQPGSLFGITGGSTSNISGPRTSVASNTANPNKDIEVPSPPDDTVQALMFNPQISGMPILLAAGSWDYTCRVWQINENNTVEPKLMQNINAPVLAIDWFEDGSKLFIASADKQVRVWDLASNQLAVIGQHDEPVRTCNWIQTPQYNCLMTGSWDKTLRFWDMRQHYQQNALQTFQLSERIYCSAFLQPYAVVALADKHVRVFNFSSPESLRDNQYDRASPLKFQSRCVAVFKNGPTEDKIGYALGSIEGRVAVQHLNNPPNNFTFKCHRSAELINNFQEIYPVNDVVFHPQYNTLATIGSDGRFCFWDKDSRSKLKNSEALPLPLTKCHINPGGQIFAYAVGYDWSKGHEGNAPGNASKIFLHGCVEDMKPKLKK